MNTIDAAELKRALAAIDAAPPYLASMRGARHRQTANAHRATDTMLESVLVNGGLDVKRLNAARAQGRQDERAAFQREVEEAAGNATATERAYREGADLMRQAQAVLDGPFTSTFVTLEKPTLITQQPRLELRTFIDNHVEPFNSSIQYKVETNSEEDYTSFNFYFIWANNSSTPAVINATSPFVLNGNCAVGAATGIFDGDTAILDLLLGLGALRWTGWGLDPATGQSLDQTYILGGPSSAFSRPISLRAHGGGFFSSADWATQSLSNQSIRLSYPMITVPAHAAVIFNMMAFFSYFFDGGGDISDLVLINFAGSGRMIRCPAVQLEVLTPVTRTGGSSVAAGGIAGTHR